MEMPNIAPEIEQEWQKKNKCKRPTGRQNFGKHRLQDEPSNRENQQFKIYATHFQTNLPSVSVRIA